jgi:ATP-dependent Clp protease ATP-binding subunit ClpA
MNDEARQLLILAERQSVLRGCNFVGSEHVLLAILRDETGACALALTNLHVTTDKFEAELNRILDFGAAQQKQQDTILPETYPLHQIELGDDRVINITSVLFEALKNSLKRDEKSGSSMPFSQEVLIAMLEFDCLATKALENLRVNVTHLKSVFNTN